MTHTRSASPRSGSRCARRWRKLARSYGHEYIDKQARSGGKTTELWQDMGKHGYLGVNIPEEYGGGGGGIGDLAAVLRGGSAARAPAAADGRLAGDLRHGDRRFGTEEQKQRWLPGIADGSLTMAFAITEPDAGSNSHNITTTGAPRRRRLGAQRPEDLHLRRRRGRRRARRGAHRRTRRPASSSPCLFVVPTDAEGLRVSADPDGRSSAPEKQFTLFLDDVRLPADALVGDEDAGLMQLFAGLNPERIMARGVLDRHGALRARQGGRLRQGARGVRGRRSARTRASRTRWPRSRSRSSWPG